MAEWKPSQPVRSRCPTCREFQTEGEQHTCPTTGKTKIHENPAAPREDKRNGK